MSVYLQATLEVKASELARFNTVMVDAVEILERQGWKLLNALIQRTGRLNTVIDIWELESFEHFDMALQAFAADPRFPDFKKALDEAVISETLVFAVKAPYAH